jgi:hypothetical protein
MIKKLLNPIRIAVGAAADAAQQVAQGQPVFIARAFGRIDIEGKTHNGMLPLILGELLQIIFAKHDTPPEDNDRL